MGEGVIAEGKNIEITVKKNQEQKRERKEHGENSRARRGMSS